MSIASQIENALSLAGSIFGDGKLTGTLTRRTRSAGTDYEPTYTSTDYTCTVLWDEVTVEERAAGIIAEDERTILIGASTLSVEPQSGDRLDVGGDSFEVKRVMSTRPGGTDLLYRAVLAA